ncbi:tyrosine-type recombinase/integrase [Colwellia sp. MEBiC06753]
MKIIHCQLSNAIIDQYLAEKTPLRLKDGTPRFYAQLHGDGLHASFYLVQKFSGRPVWELLGQYPSMSVSQARKALVIAQQRLYQQYAIGHYLQAPFTGQTLTQALLHWALARGQASQQLKPASKRNLQTQVTGQLLPRLGEVPVGQLDRLVIDTQLMQPLLAQFKASTVSSIFQTLKWCFSQAMHAGMLHHNPVATLRFRDYVAKAIAPRQGRLTVVQLPMVFDQLSKAKPTQRLLGLLLLLFGTRVGETIKAKWSAFDFKARVWRIPGSDTKTGQPHQLPLTSEAITLLQQHRLALSHRHKRGEYVFPKQRDIRQCQTAQAGSQQIGKVAQGQWSAHDLRKLCRTSWTELGVDHLIGELLLNHQPSQLDKAYIQTLAKAQCREAITGWHQYLMDNGFAAFLSGRSAQDRLSFAG